MDCLELHLKLDRMDPSQVPEAAVKHKTKMHAKMNSDWTEVDTKGKQLVKDATDVCRPPLVFTLFIFFQFHILITFYRFYSSPAQKVIILIIIIIITFTAG